MVCKAQTCTHCTGEEGCCKPDPCTWSRKNWCCLLRVIFAIIGIGVPLLMFLRPCESSLEVYESFFTETQYFNISERQPVDLYFVIDGSGSMLMPKEKWTNQLLSTQIFMQTFNESIPDVRYGLGIFSDEQSRFVTHLSDDKSIIESVTSLTCPGGGTQYEIALQMFQLQILLNGRNDGQFIHNTNETFTPVGNNLCHTINNVVYHPYFPIGGYFDKDCEWEISQNGYLVIHAYGFYTNGRATRFFLNGYRIQDTLNVEQIRVQVQSGDRFKYYGDSSDLGFVAYIEQPYHVQDGSTKSIMVFISDGSPNQVVFEEKMVNLAQTLKLRHDIIGIMINSDASTTFDLCRISNCFELTGCIDRTRRDKCVGGNGTHCIGEESCPYFIYEPDFEVFRNEAQQIARTVVDTIPVTVNTTSLQNTTAFNQVEETCTVAPWLIFLLLLIPLLLQLCVGCTIDRKQKIVRKKEVVQKPKVLKPPPLPPAVKRAPTQPPSENVNIPGKPGGKRFKWDIQAADQYLWGAAGGATPMKVDFAGKAPPSAPKDLSKGQKCVCVETWEAEDGYTYEALEVEATMEEWAEEKIVEVAKTSLFQWLCCCCLCKAFCMICRPFCCKWCCFVKEDEETITTPSSPRNPPPPPPPGANIPVSGPPPAPPIHRHVSSSVEDPAYDMRHLWDHDQSTELSSAENYNHMTPGSTSRAGPGYSSTTPRRDGENSPTAWSS